MKQDPATCDRGEDDGIVRKTTRHSPRRGKRMRQHLQLAGLATVAVFAAGFVTTIAQAEDLAITNARIIVGNGEVIESGTLLVREGRIAEEEVICLR